MNPQPPPSSLTASTSSFFPFLSGRYTRVVLGVDDPEEPGVAEVLGAAAALQDPAVQEHADLVAVADLELFHLVAVGVDVGPRVQDLRSRLRLEALGEVGRERDPRMRRLAIAVEHDESGRLRLDVLPLHRGALGARADARDCARARRSDGEMLHRVSVPGGIAGRCRSHRASGVLRTSKLEK